MSNNLTQEQLEKLLKQHQAVDKWWKGLTLLEKEKIKSSTHKAVGWRPLDKAPKDEKSPPPRKPPPDEPMEAGRGPQIKD